VVNSIRYPWLDVLRGLVFVLLPAMHFELLKEECRRLLARIRHDEPQRLLFLHSLLRWRGCWSIPWHWRGKTQWPPVCDPCVRPEFSLVYPDFHVRTRQIRKRYLVGNYLPYCDKLMLTGNVHLWGLWPSYLERPLEYVPYNGLLQGCYLICQVHASSLPKLVAQINCWMVAGKRHAWPDWWNLESRANVDRCGLPWLKPLRWWGIQHRQVCFVNWVNHLRPYFLVPALRPLRWRKE